MRTNVLQVGRGRAVLFGFFELRTTATFADTPDPVRAA
jgi:hypothetical protein